MKPKPVKLGLHRWASGCLEEERENQLHERCPLSYMNSEISGIAEAAKSYGKGSIYKDMHGNTI